MRNASSTLTAAVLGQLLTNVTLSTPGSRALVHSLHPHCQISTDHNAPYNYNRYSVRHYSWWDQLQLWQHHTCGVTTVVCQCWTCLCKTLVNAISKQAASSPWSQSAANVCIPELYCPALRHYLELAFMRYSSM